MRYPLIEAATAGLFAGVAARIGFSWTLPAYLVLAAGLLALACTDIEHLLLPKRIVYPVLGLVGTLLLAAAGWLGVRYVLLGFFAANLIGAVIGIALIASKRMSRQQQIPYGVFLAVGTLLAIFAGPELLRPFQSLQV